ncbi:GNAT family N-acetyltransferase [Hymenobacter jeollabukensis]|uniref:GNAT family N-acetyltransferase n=1 Tax=Hymenobacter jeollabukensis TaxID=2025313 RepID=A0A5R8WSP2_9BACT|nr:GNAT family N-acetyltransferase [Hymenobacter jeollabukensis]TLM94201.1 GNAT family N-acetyltransferase [Hymenobacter jeollabukensis]
MLTTPRLQLIPCTPAHFEAALAGHHVLAAVLGVAAEAGWPGSEEARQALAPGYQHLRRDPGLAPWWIYLLVHRADQRLIGLAGFKGRPDEQGAVELGYSVADAYRGQGLATEAAQALVQYAFAQPAVRRVTALTQPQRNASCRVLEKAGMAYEGPVLDPNWGEVWQWGRLRPVAAPVSLAAPLRAAGLILLLALGSCGGEADNATAPPTAAPADAVGLVDAGQALFEQNCALCHGPDGKRGLNGAHDLTKSNLNQMGRAYMVTNGMGKMPAFKGQLTPEQIEQVAAYSLTLK